MPRRTTQVQRGEPVERTRRRLRLEYLILFLVLAGFSYKFVQRMQEVHRLQTQEAALAAQNRATAADNARLQRALRYYRTDQYIQEEARAVLGYTMPGEVSILTTRPRMEAPAISSAPAAPPPTPQPSWEQWWHAFSR